MKMKFKKKTLYHGPFCLVLVILTKEGTHQRIAHRLNNLKKDFQRGSKNFDSFM